MLLRCRTVEEKISHRASINLALQKIESGCIKFAVAEILGLTVC